MPKIARLGIIGTTIQGFDCPGLSWLAALIVGRDITGISAFV